MTAFSFTSKVAEAEAGAEVEVVEVAEDAEVAEVAEVAGAE